MKKEYSIVFEALGLGYGVINLHPYTDKRYETEEDAEKAIAHLLTGQGFANKRFYIVPCYSLK